MTTDSSKKNEHATVQNENVMRELDVEHSAIVQLHPKANNVLNCAKCIGECKIF